VTDSPTGSETGPPWPASPSGYRYVCHYCVWCWPIKWWLPFDFELARWAHRRHMRRVHQSKWCSVHKKYSRMEEP